MADPKEKLESQPEAPAADLATDREQGLSLQFDDLGLEELMPSLAAESSEAAPAPAEAAPAAENPALLQEVAEAVHDLVLDLGSGESAADSVATAGLDVLPGVNTLSFDVGAELAAADGVEPLLIEGTGIETASNVARLEVADRMFELLVCEKSFNDLCEHILGAFVKAASATAGSILELDYEKNEFFFRASFGGGDPEKLKSFRVPMNKGIVGHVAESKQSLLLNDMERDERQLRAISMSTGFEIVSCMAFPILITNRLYGVVEIFNKAGGARFEKADLQLMEDGARMAAKVLEVRFLMAELLRRSR